MSFAKPRKTVSDMARYIATYKCPICGTLLFFGQPAEIPYDKLPELCGKVIRNQMFINNPALYQAPMHIHHKCPDGSCGLAYFAGFKKE